MPDSLNRPRDFSQYDAMTTEELEELLRLDAQNLEGESDVEALMYITEVIRKRKKPDPNRKTPEEAFKIFKTHYLTDDFMLPDLPAECPREEPCRKEGGGKVIALPHWIRRFVSAAAVLALLVLAGCFTSSVLGQNLWAGVVRWTKEAFQLVSTEDPVSSTGNSLQHIWDPEAVLEEYGPKWFPKGYELADVKVMSAPAWDNITAIYTKGDLVITVGIRQYRDSQFQYNEQSNMTLEVYDTGKNKYYIFINNTIMHAVWVKDNMECSISGDVRMEEIKAMIDSIEE